MSNLIELIKQLRDMTGAGIMDAKKALVENDNDLDKAVTWLREKGLAKQAKKAGRIAAEGVAWVLIDNNDAAVIEINCETDFVANSDPFRDLVAEVNKIVLKNKPKDKEEAMNCKNDAGKSINDLFLDATIKLGEKLDFRRFALIEKKDNQLFGPYIHMKGKLATLVILEGGNSEVANDVALNVCANNPTYISYEDIPSEIIEKETEIEKEASKNDLSFLKKPANIQEKIIEGKIKKTLSSLVLLDETCVLDESKTVAALLKESNAKVVSFIRYAVGEGIEKRENDFASEVASQIK